MSAGRPGVGSETVSGRTRFIRFLVVVGLAGVLALVLYLGNRSNPPDTVNAITAKVSGQIPTIQYVGVPVTVNLRVRSTGDDLPHVVLDLGGCNDHWTIDRVSSNGATVSRSSAGAYYDAGPLASGETLSVHAALVPNDAGNHTCDVSVYGDAGTDGSPSGDALQSLTATVAINP